MPIQMWQKRKRHIQKMRILIILSILFLTACSSTGKPIKEHRLIVSAVKQVISPGIGFGK